MKNIILAFVLCLAVNVVTLAQKIKMANLPEPIKAAFKVKFPAATGVKWEKENDKEFEAEFKLGKVEHSAKFDATGNWIETETEIEKSDLPVSALEYIAKNYTGYHIDEAEKVEHSTKGNLFEVEVEKGESEMELIFDSTGKFLEEKVESKMEEKSKK